MDAGHAPVNEGTSTAADEGAATGAGASSLSGDDSLFEHFDVVEAMLIQKKWEILSAMLNLAIIAVFGVIFEGIAFKLNSYENHRTEAEFADALIAKNFACVPRPTPPRSASSPILLFCTKQLLTLRWW